MTDLQSTQLGEGHWAGLNGMGQKKDGLGLCKDIKVKGDYW